MKITRPYHPIRVKIDLPSSKSISNRLLLIEALSGNDFQIINLSRARDTQILELALKGIVPFANNTKPVAINIADAGTPMRFLTAFLCITPGKWLLTGSLRMCERTVGPLVDALRSLGAQIEYSAAEGFPPLLIQGDILKGKEVSIEAGISSQFISALMLIAPVLPHGLSIKLLGKASSAPYVFMTSQLMKQAGVNLIQSEEIIHIEHQRYSSGYFKVEPDWSAAAFWYEIAALLGDAIIELKGLNASGLQGDSQVADIFTYFGVKTQFTDEGVIISKSETPIVDHFSFDFTTCPDLFLPVAVTCAGLNIAAMFTGLMTLRIKESDRIKVLFSELRVMGYNVIELPGDIIKIMPDGGPVSSGEAKSIRTYNDHRMAMAFAPLALLNEVIDISEPDVVNKSYPDYWDHLAEAGFVLEF
jgi:3-phosphoshikimate 1-carboxyvinyltransferase